MSCADSDTVVTHTGRVARQIGTGVCVFAPTGEEMRVVNGPGDDLDPTGVRELLAALPDPGPIPEHVAARIHAALREQGLRPDGLDDGAEELEVALGMPPVLLYDDDPIETGPDPFGAAGTGHLASVSELRSRARRWPVLGAAAATVAALAIGGALLAGNNRGGGLSASVAPGSVKVTSPSPMPSANPTQKVQIQTSTRTYTSADLTAQAQSLLDPTVPAATPVGSGLGPIGTPEGLAACVATLGEDDADSITADLALFDGQPAVIIVAVKDGLKQVYVVARDCGKGDPGILQEGTPLN